MSDEVDTPAMISGTISFEDFRAAQMAHTHEARNAVRYVFIASALAGLVLLATSYTLAGATLLIGAGVGAHAQRTLGNRLLAKAYDQHADLRSRLDYWWDEESISARNAMGQSKRPWTSYVRVREDEHAFALYQTDHLFEMVPKAWFTSAEQLAQFRRLARPEA